MLIIKFEYFTFSSYGSSSLPFYLGFSAYGFSKMRQSRIGLPCSLFGERTFFVDIFLRKCIF